jgi:phosphatidylglycerophosphate synthase
MIRRHLLCAERAGAQLISVVCQPDDAGDLARATVGMSVRVRIDPLRTDELEPAFARWRRPGAVVLPCTYWVDVPAARALAERASPGRLILAGEGSAHPSPGIARLGSPDERRAARRALCRSVYKPTDNVFARLNRRVSVPITLGLCKTPLSPNAVSLLGLVLSILAGVMCAFGGYRWMLAAAFTGWSSSMIDGCDGELARMTFRESAFGCWLESICDDLYYVSIFLGMAVGLARKGDAALMLLVGIIALGGFVLTSIVHLILRAKIAAANGGRPSGFARAFEERMNALGTDPVARFARTAYKIGTRSTLPYLLVLLAFVGQTRISLVLVAIGAHCYWMLTLYLWWATPPPLAEPSPRRTTAP